MCIRDRGYTYKSGDPISFNIPEEVASASQIKSGAAAQWKWGLGKDGVWRRTKA